MEIFDLDFEHLYKTLLQLLIACILPMFTAWERESSTRTAGLRTFPLVSMAACSFTILAMSMFSDADAQGKIIAGIITGIGFIGGGAILKQDSNVSGTSTAAAIWSTGAVGIAVGLGRIEIALALSIITFVIFTFFGSIKKQVNK